MSQKTRAVRRAKGLCYMCGNPSAGRSRCDVCRHREQATYALKMAGDIAKRQPKSCAQCGVDMGVDYKPKGGRPSKFCSDRCGDLFRNAEAQSAKNRGGFTREFLNDIRRHNREFKKQDLRMKASLANTQRVCRICGASFEKPLFRPGTWKLCMSDECRQKAHTASLRKNREVNGTKPGERARRRGLPYERCGAIAVCTRDKWRCQLCGVSTPRRLRGTIDLRAPEVDHIIPLSYPGSPGHVWSNVQCACRRCNLAKSDKPLGQLRLAV